LVLLVVVLAGCGTAAARSAETSVAPAGPLRADRGCLDEPGTLDATAEDWYPGDSDGWLSPNSGTQFNVEGAALAAFQQAATQAIATVATGVALDDGLEVYDPQQRCVTHRHARFTDGDADIVVSAWRVLSDANPFWVPNEAPFESVDESTLLSRGEHIAVVLVVAADGTTARVSAYGAGAADSVSGWPTTTPPPPSAPPPGLVGRTVEDLIPAADDVLAFVLDQR
jgi:hypothetical protein